MVFSQNRRACTTETQITATSMIYCKWVKPYHHVLVKSHNRAVVSRYGILWFQQSRVGKTTLNLNHINGVNRTAKGSRARTGTRRLHPRVMDYRLQPVSLFDTTHSSCALVMQNSSSRGGGHRYSAAGPREDLITC